jgi:hypothetical protein
MTHHPSLTATAAKIIHTTAQLCRRVKYWLLLCVCVDMVPYTVGQRVFLYEPYVKCCSARKCRRKIRRKFPGITVPSTTGIHKLINKVWSTGSLLDKKPSKTMPCAYRRKIRRNKG